MGTVLLFAPVCLWVLCVFTAQSVLYGSLQVYSSVQHPKVLEFQDPFNLSGQNDIQMQAPLLMCGGAAYYTFYLIRFSF